MNQVKVQLLEKVRISHHKWPWLGIFLLFIVIIAFHGWSLMRFPQLFVDEAWAANRAWGFLQTGRVFGTLDSDFMTEFPGYWTYFPLLQVLAQASVLQFSTVPSLLAMRLLSLFWGLVLLGSIYWIGRRLLGPRQAVIGLLLVAFSWPFCISAHWARADIMAAALGYGAMAIYLAPQTPRLWTSLAAGFMVGLAFEVHPNAAIFGPGLLALSWAIHGWRLWRERDLWGIVAGGMLGMVLYAALHIIPYPDTYFAFNEIFFAATHTPPLLTGDLRVILQSFAEAAGSLFQIQPLVVLAAISWGSLLRRRGNSHRGILALSMVLFLFYGLLVRNKAPYYAIVLTPVLDLLTVPVLLEELTRPWKGRVFDYVQRVVVWGLVLAVFARVLLSVGSDSYPDYLVVQSNIDASVRPHERVMAPQTYWFGLYKCHYDSWEELVYYQRYQPDSKLEEALGFYRPDIFIVDGHLRNFVRDDVGETLYSRHLRLPQSELEAFLNANTQLVSEFDGGIYGWVQVYRVSWP